MRVDELDTPSLTVDLDAVERNIAAMQARADARGLALRPHIKTHKLLRLAHLQLAAGAVGITCQKLGEAEVMAAAGIDDILLSFPLVGQAKTRRFAALAREIRIAAVGDSAYVARGLSDALAEAGAEASFLVECDTGFGRTGVQSPREAVELATLASTLPGLRFAGFMTYPMLPESGPWLQAAVDLTRARGLEVSWVSGGGTPPGRWEAAAAAAVLTEMRAGTYVYGDRTCIADGSVALESCALHVRATIVSRPNRGRAILDAGSKALTSDRDPALEGYGYVCEYPEALLYALNEEHGYLDVSRCARRPEVGEAVTIVPNHACVTTNMYDEVAAHRSGEIVATWTIASRGKVQ